ncbi:MAG: hypothetical protein KDK66_05490 [Deltaproteobacteria bacterium]|nr:hypothetical protein [Deltaproteobacteria bacterium]
MNLHSIAKKLGQKGGRARAKKLSAKVRSQIASSGGKARAESYRAKHIIQSNFAYLEFVETFLPKPKVKRVNQTQERLPGIYI